MGLLEAVTIVAVVLVVEVRFECKYSYINIFMYLISSSSSLKKFREKKISF